MKSCLLYRCLWAIYAIHAFLPPLGINFLWGPCKFAPTILMWPQLLSSGAPRNQLRHFFSPFRPGPSCGPGGSGLQGGWFPLAGLRCDPKEAAV